jgi:5-deoxy-glucuronate isomerase
VSQPSLRYRKKIDGSGYHELVSPACAPLQHITLGLERFGAGVERSIGAPDHEIVLVLLNGKLTVSGGAIEQPVCLQRRSVFEEEATAVYIAAGEQISLRAQTASEAAFAKAPCSVKGGAATQIVFPAGLKRREVGNDNWRRTVYDLIPGEFPAQKLIVGETFNPPGNWSSSPPHKHDRHDPPRESQFEEVYFYRLDPPQGFALQRVYSAEGDLDVCYAVEQNDVVVLPRGYHPVVAAPGYRLYYLWVLAGQGRDPVWFEDPAHAWIHQPGGKRRGGRS